MRLLLSTILLCLATMASGAPRVVASIEPLAMVLREVLGDQVVVSTLMLPGQTPHFAAMTPGQARQLQQAGLLVWLGPEAEPALARLVARLGTPSLSVLALPSVTVRRGDGHGHDNEHDHGALTLDPHLWLSPDNMQRLAESLVEQAARLQLDPAVVDANARRFRERLAAVDGAARASLAPLAGSPWLSHHNPFGYFSDHFGLREPLQISDSIAGEASARRFAVLARQMADESVHCAIAEPEARRDLLLRLCQDECRVVAVDPLGREQAGAHYSVFLASVASRFSQCLSGN